MDEYSVLKSGIDHDEFLTGIIGKGYGWTKNPEFRYTFEYQLAAYLAITEGGYIRKE